MLKSSLIGAALSAVLAGGAAAANCPNYPYTLTNGTTADAIQVMDNFNAILGCANTLAPLVSPQFTGNVTIATPASGDALGVAGIGRFLSPGVGTTGAVAIRDAAGDPGAAYLQFVSNDSLNQLGFILGLKTRGLELGGGYVGVETPTPSLPFYVNGQAGGTTDWWSGSDARLKKDVQTITGALALVERLRGVSFEWRPVSERTVGKGLDLPLGVRQIGLIAQEVEPVVPEAVKAGSDGVYGVKEGTLVPILIEAVKAQQAEIDELKAQVAALKSGH